MKKINNVIIKETIYISVWTLILSALMQGVFIILYNCLPQTFTDPYYEVVLGNLLGAFVAILNFFLMGLSVQKSVSKEEQKDAKAFMRLSMMLRFILLIITAVLGAVVPIFNLWATIIPLFFPRIGLLFRSFSLKKGGKNSGNGTESNENDQIQNS